MAEKDEHQRVAIVSTITGKRLLSTAIKVITATAQQRQVLARNGVLYFDPAISPDRNTIAFAALLNPAQKRTNIYAMRLNSTVLLQLSRAGPNEMAGSPTWSPDGKRICFHLHVRDPGGGFHTRSWLYVVNRDGTGLRHLREGIGPVWAPVGDKILHLDADYRITISDLVGHTSRRLEAAPEAVGIAGAGAWSPDGMRVAFTQISKGRTDIYLAGTTGKERRRITSSEGVKASLNWLQDGRHILYTAVGAMPLGPENATVNVVDVSSLETHRLTDPEHLSWTSTGVFGTLVAEIMIAEFLDAKLHPPK